MITNTRKEINLKKLETIELEEMLKRQKSLLASRLLQNLPDKGKAVRKLIENIEEELNMRKETIDITESLNQLTIDTIKDKHVQKICSIEKTPEKDRFKPFCSLNKTIDPKPDSKAVNSIEDSYHPKHPTKLIPLAESMDLLTQAEQRVKAEQVRAKYARAMEKLQAEEYSDEESQKSDSDNENTPNYSFNETED